MNNFKKYPSYKDSEIDSLGQVPEHWNQLKINHFTQVVSEKCHQNEELLSVYRDYGVIPKNSRTDNHNKDGEDLSSYKLVKPGYLVLNKMKTWQGSLGVSNFRGIVSPAYITCKVKGDFFDNNYLHYLLRSEKYIFQYKRISYGVRVDQWDMRYDDFKNLIVFAPPLPEQTAIANFLDKKTAEIKEFIALKEKTIALLKERKMAIINQAVTKGLDPTVEMKDSGIEWLGEIPKHWEVKKIKTICTQISNQVSKKADNEIFISLEKIISWSGEYDLTIGEDIFESNVKTFKYGDVLFGRLRPYLAKVVCPDQDGVCVGELLVLRPRNTVKTKFLQLILLSKQVIELIDSSTFGSKMPRANWEFIGNVQIPIPPLNEQKLIVNEIILISEKISTSIEFVKKEIELIKEYQQSLISEVVTGKLDVSTSARQL